MVDIDWTPSRLRALGSTVRAQCWPIADKVKDALDCAANYFESMQRPVKDRKVYEDEATRVIGFARCGYLDLRAYERVHLALTDAFINEAMAIQSEGDAIEQLQACRDRAKAERAISPAASEAK